MSLRGLNRAVYFLLAVSYGQSDQLLLRHIRQRDSDFPRLIHPAHKTTACVSEGESQISEITGFKTNKMVFHTYPGVNVLAALQACG